MSLHDDLRAAQRCLDDLARSVGRLEQQVGEGPDIRRVRSDTDHLLESLALLKETTPDRTLPEAGADVIIIPEAPYNNALWTDVDEEGIGARDRHAP
ncbi:MAG TPA: hypothetical protein DEQ61_11070 [Streptomyces sp.]|nr:hypothetical protein [Streptomyces sp.]